MIIHYLESADTGYIPIEVDEAIRKQKENYPGKYVRDSEALWDFCCNGWVIESDWTKAEASLCQN